jgi:hypothetical protein
MKIIYYDDKNPILKEELLKGFIVTLSNDKKYHVLFNDDNIRNESELSYCLSKENEYDFITVTTLKNQIKLIMKNKIIDIELINIVKLKLNHFINYYKLNLDEKYKLIKTNLNKEFLITSPFYQKKINHQ